ncbi:hypothetical protein [Acrocarpospora catenulata]|uniref:hypothetical protein n=1 Tax=Acrocarpospora catenulata TaxID=2836182 RepID=UPI001BDADDFF|nr:hypothetical protein [Acrocarpospora catenulata]
MVRVESEWALWGRDPGDESGPAILRHGGSRFEPGHLAAALVRFYPGTLEVLPQVTFGWIGEEGPDTHLGLAVHDWAQDPEGSRRRSLTRYFAVPFGTLASGRVSYEGMFDAFAACAIPDGPDGIGAVLPPLDPGGLASAVNETVKRAAALLLSGHLVCVVGADEVPWRIRLRFLDAVAALLPYGLRAGLATATWTSSAVGHRIRLSFASQAPEGARRVIWGHDESGLPEPAQRVLHLLNRIVDFTDLIAWQAAQATPRAFEERDLSDALVDMERFVAGSPSDKLVQLIGEGLGDPASLAEVAHHAHTLQEMEGRPSAADREYLRQVIRTKHLFTSGSPAGQDERLWLYRTLLSLAYPSPLDRSVLQDAGRDPDPLLLRELAERSWSDQAAYYLVLAQLDQNRLRKEMRTASAGTLVEACATATTTHDLGRLALEELLRRKDVGRDLANALNRHGQLAIAIRRLHPDDPERQRAVHRDLLRSAYGRSVDSRVLLRAVPALEAGPAAPLFAAALDLASAGEREQFIHTWVHNWLRANALATEDGPPLVPHSGGVRRLRPDQTVLMASMMATVLVALTFIWLIVV